MKRVIFVFIVIAVHVAFATLGWRFYKRAHDASDFSVSVEDGLKPPASAGDRAPHFEGITIDGASFKLEPSGHEASLVVFWASWCPPCAEETPALIDLAKRHPDWQVIAVSNDSTEHEIRDFLKIFPSLVQPNIHIVWDLERKIASHYGVTGLPESYRLDREGKLVQKFIGAMDWKKF